MLQEDYAALGHSRALVIKLVDAMTWPNSVSHDLLGGGGGGGGGGGDA